MSATPSAAPNPPRDDSVQPPWVKPTVPSGSPSWPGLKVLNSLTRQKDDFVPVKGKIVSWYACGPTVYDHSHLGHARTYMSTDIMRRILEGYFGYEVLLVMNVTDVDDKIILRARQTHLFSEFSAANPTVTAELLGTTTTALAEFVTSSFKVSPATEPLLPPKPTEPDAKDLSQWVEEVWKRWEGLAEDGRRKVVEAEPKFEMRIKAALSAAHSLSTPLSTPSSTFLSASRDVLSPHLDRLYGHTVTDPAVYARFSREWENEFFADMDALGIKRPDAVTRVSEYVDEIKAFVQGIVDKGFGYASPSGSVYFDTLRFHTSPGHFYCKLEPKSRSDLALQAEGEGDLSTGKEREKRNAADFALWKASKAGEPWWESQWGKGRPGWHIECSAMASAILPHPLDVHSGGTDLRFPHHDNEIAQSEACLGTDQWVNYWWHAGHLNVEGLKMSKSLKNFITIKEALATSSANQMRLLFLAHTWSATLDYKKDSLEEARRKEDAIKNFLAASKSLVAEARQKEAELTGDSAISGKHNYGKWEADLMESLLTAQSAVHTALADSFDTPTALEAVLVLVSRGNVYLNGKPRDGGRINADVVTKVSKWVRWITEVWGIRWESDGGRGKLEDELLPYLQVLSKFRDGVRELARKRGDSDILALSDKLRDEDLVDLGVQLGDRDDGTALVTFGDPASLRASRDEKRAKEAERRRLKEAKLREELQREQERLEKGRTPPTELFRGESNKSESGEALYSAWDEQGVPTHDGSGAELAKTRRKKLQKEWDIQAKLHEKFLAHVSKMPSSAK